MNGDIDFKALRRIEMVLPSNQIDEVSKKMDALGIAGYTVIKDVVGRGQRGMHHDAGLLAFQYSYLLLACDEAKVGAVAAVARPYLKLYGGLCLVSDARLLIA